MPKSTERSLSQKLIALNRSTNDYRLYDMPGLAPCMDGLSWGRHDFQVSFSNRDTLKIVIKEFLWSIRGSYQTIWSFPLTIVNWHSVIWPYTMAIPYWSDFVPNSTFCRIVSGFRRTFATIVACRQWTLNSPDTWSLPFGTCMCSTCWDLSFFQTCRYFSGLYSSIIPRYFLDFALNRIFF